MLPYVCEVVNGVYLGTSTDTPLLGLSLIIALKTKGSY